MEVRVARLDKCPAPSHVVGFTILHTPSSRSLYLDAFVPLDSCDGHETEEQIVEKGWELVQKAAENWIDECEKKSSSLVGSIFDPTRKTASS